LFIILNIGISNNWYILSDKSLRVPSAIESRSRYYPFAITKLYKN